MSRELLLEIRTDPMPADGVEDGARRLKNALVTALRRKGLPPKQSATGFSARRLLVLFRGLPAEEGEKDAPPDDTILQAVAEVVQTTVEGLEWPTMVRWGGGHRWVSPVRGLVLLLDGVRVPATVFGLAATDWTVGPENLGCPAVKVEGADSYGRMMNDFGVELRFPERRRQLQEGLETLATQSGGELLQDGRLLRSRAISCETPSVISVEVEGRFRSLPVELLQVCVRDRLEGFCVVSSDEIENALFVLDRPDDPDGSAVRGFGWALATYLDDVSFFLERDRRRPLAESCRELEPQTISPELGTYGERSRRCTAIGDLLCSELDWSGERDRAREAIRLLAADGRTELLRVFPDLEGVIGGLLAREEGYPASVWQAIADSRRTARDSRSMPRGRVGKLVALAERCDRLASRFVVRPLQSEGTPSTAEGEERRRLLDQIVRIAVAGGMPLDLRLVTAFAARQRLEEHEGHRLRLILDELNELLDESLERVFRSLGFSPTEIAAVTGADGSSLLGEQVQKLEGLRSLRGDQRLASLAQTAQRLTGILQGSSEHELDVGILEQGAEKDLYHSYRRRVEEIESSLTTGSFATWLQRMTELDRAVEGFLRKVLIRDENERLRQNRLALLQRVYWLYAGELRLAELTEGN